MVDLHTHILFGVDDGTKTLEEALEVLKYGKEMGIDTVVCTPHFGKGKFLKKYDELLELFNTLKQEANKIGVSLYLGQEVYANKSVYDWVENGSVRTINQSRYLLIEFPMGETVEFDEIIYDLSLQGITPIIAHPERYSYFSEKLIVAWIMAGAKIQVNGESLLGGHGLKVKKNAKLLLKKGLVHLISSDTHDNTKRRPLLHDVEKKYAKKFDLNRLMNENPMRIINDREVL